MVLTPDCGPHSRRRIELNHQCCNVDDGALRLAGMCCVLAALYITPANMCCFYLTMFYTWRVQLWAEHNGAASPECLALARIYEQALDALKNGIKVWQQCALAPHTKSYRLFLKDNCHACPACSLRFLGTSSVNAFLPILAAFVCSATVPSSVIESSLYFAAHIHSFQSATQAVMPLTLVM